MNSGLQKREQKSTMDTSVIYLLPHLLFWISFPTMHKLVFLDALVQHGMGLRLFGRSLFAGLLVGGFPVFLRIALRADN